MSSPSQGRVAFCAIVLWFSAHAVAEPIPGAKPSGLIPLDAEPAVQRVSRIMHCGDIDWFGEGADIPAPTAVSATGAPTGSPTGSPKPRSQAAMPVLARSMLSEDSETRLRALEGLSQTEDPANIDIFLAAFSDPSDEVRTFAGRMLAKYEPREVSESVLRSLADPESDVFRNIDHVLPDLKETVEATLLEVLQSDKEPVERRTAAAYGLGRVSSVAAIPTLVDLAWSRDDTLSVTCAHALCAIRDPFVVSALVRLVGYHTREVQIAALGSLAAMGGKQPMEALAVVAAQPPNEDAELARYAVRLMGAAEDEAVVPLLVDILSKNADVRTVTIQALRQLTGEYAGDSPSDWINWYRRKLENANRSIEEQEEGIVDVGSLVP